MKKSVRVQTFSCCRMINIKILSSAKPVNIFSINSIVSKEMTLITCKKLIYFSITPRLKRLFMSSETIKLMT